MSNFTCAIQKISSLHCSYRFIHAYMTVGSQEVQLVAENNEVCSNQVESVAGCTEICSAQEEDWEARRAQIKMTKGFVAKESVKGHMASFFYQKSLRPIIIRSKFCT